MPEFKLEPGSTVSHFRLEKKLGEGGMGSVYLAEDLTLSRRVAIKFMSRAEIGQQATAKVVENLEQRFIREAKSAAAINHPNVAQIYEANFETDNWFIAMELIQGQALSEMIEAGETRDPEQVVQILSQAAGGLKFAWDHFKIVHRDIKPHNLMMTEAHQVKIVDLGLAKPLASAEADYDMPELTGAGVPLGTPQYMAPEQAAGDTELDLRADIYALGATMYELLTGKKAFTGKTAPMIYIAQMKKEYIPLCEARPEVPEQLAKLIDDMLEPNASQRVGSYAELLQRLATLGSELGYNGTASANFVTASGTIPMDRAREGRDEPADQYAVDATILNRYKVIKHLGRSRAGVVYLCIDTETKRDCAVKSLLPGREFPVECMERIRQNFERLEGIRHPNLVAIDDVHLNPENGELLVVMELLRGQNLRQYTHHEVTRHGDLRPAQIAPVAQLVAKALDEVAAQVGFGHGDIKPESVYLVKDDSEVKLLDYGITEDADRGPVMQSGKVTVPLASPDYMAPERWKGDPPTPAADQYSLAVVIHEMLAHKLPFWLKDQESGTTTQLDVTELTSELNLLKNMNRRVLSQPAPRIEGLSETEQATLDKALAKQPEERYASSGAFVSALCGTPAAAPAVASKKPPIALIAGIAAVVLVLIGILAVVMLKDGEPELPEAPGPTDGLVDGGPVEPPPRATDDDPEAGRRAAVAALRGRAEQRWTELKAAPAEGPQPRWATVESLMSEGATAEAAAEWTAATVKYDEALAAMEAEAARLAAAREAADAQRRETLAELKAEVAEELQRLRQADAPREALAELQARSQPDGLSVAAETDHLRALLADAKTLLKRLQAEAAKAADAAAAAQAEAERLAQLQAETRQRLGALANAVTDLAERPAAAEQKGFTTATGMLAQARRELAAEEPAAATETLTALDKQLTEIREEAARQEALQAKVKAEAERLKATVEEQLAALRKEPRVAALPQLTTAEDLLKAATARIEVAAYGEAVTELKGSLESLQDAELAARQAARIEAQALQQQVRETLQGAADLAGLDPTLDELKVKADVALALAREAMQKETFDFAITQFQQVLTTTEQMHEHARKYEAIPGRNFTVPRVGMEMVWIEPLKMWAGAHEVTNGQFRKYKPSHISKKTEDGFNLNGDRQPVCWVKYFDAVAYSTWLNATLRQSGALPDGYEFRLPSAAEWKSLARCGENRIYPWGNSWPPKYGNFGNQEVFPESWDLEGYTDEFPVTCDVAQSGENTWGLFGMAGNVWEWTTDEEGGKRAVYGASWSDVNRMVLVIDIKGFNFADPSDEYDNIGFRLLLAPVADE